jgi:hypothetical protein
MPQTRAVIPVQGEATTDAHGLLLTLSHRLDGQDTFLTGRLVLDDGTDLEVRILTFDQATVLRPAPSFHGPDPSTAWSGLLYLPHGWRPKPVPDDLAEAVAHRGADLTVLDSAELRYTLTFLDEACTPQIRAARIEVIVRGLTQARDGTS